MEEMFTQPATLNRLRTLAGKTRRAQGVAVNATVEVGHRTHPMASAILPRPQADGSLPWYREEDDLMGNDILTDACHDHDVRKYGAIVHLYAYNRDGSLEGICVGWMGTPGQSPQLLDSDGRALMGPVVPLDPSEASEGPFVPARRQTP
jgi:hypothetical protein